jgi:hypothetical protein
MTESFGRKGRTCKNLTRFQLLASRRQNGSRKLYRVADEQIAARALAATMAVAAGPPIPLRFFYEQLQWKEYRWRPIPAGSVR